jgi:hypothetical protein
MKGKLILAGLTAASMAVVGAGGAQAKPAFDGSNKTVEKPCVDSTTGETQGEFVWVGPIASWPPNHKDKTATVYLYDQDDETLTDDVTLAVVGAHDEATYDDNGVATGEENGAGKTDPVTDARGGTGAGTGSASTPVVWRSERSGRGDGRTYTFTATGTTDGASAPEGLGTASLATCDPVTFTVDVPHDMGKGDGKPSGSRKKARRARR